MTVYNPYDRLSGTAFDDPEPEQNFHRMDMGQLEQSNGFHAAAGPTHPWRIGLTAWSDWAAINPDQWSYLISNLSYWTTELGPWDAVMSAFHSSGGDLRAVLGVVGQNAYLSGYVVPSYPGSGPNPLLVKPYPADIGGIPSPTGQPATVNSLAFEVAFRVRIRFGASTPGNDNFVDYLAFILFSYAYVADWQHL